MIERVEISGVVIAVGIALYWGWVRMQLWRLRKTTPQTPGLESLNAGRPAILYFSSPGCVPCQVAQEPALDALESELGAGLQVIKIDATAEPAVADYWGVLSVPTTFVIDHLGRPRRVNHGVASAARLRGQLKELGEWHGPPQRSHEHTAKETRNDKTCQAE
jgi:thiol-disulfide isomerase/thioredoxin